MYADATFYKDEYLGKNVPDEELDSQLSLASAVVDQITYFRIKDFDKLTPFQQKQVKLAVCTQADFAFDSGEIPDWIGSYSIGSVSVSKVEGSDTRVSSKARGYLMPTNLLYGGLG